MPRMVLIAAFRNLHLKIQINIEIGSWSAIMAAVVDQRVVAICHPVHDLSRESRVSVASLMQYPLVFRTRDSSTQRAVDRAFRAVNLRASPAIIVNTREGMLEAVANRLGVGFVWEHSSSRVDRIAKVAIAEIKAESPEYIFSLAGRRGKLVELFYLARSLSPSADGADILAAP
ncbi:LysR family transcriptional regulator substrate-binding protein [Bradyrhizobium sp. A5]|uniref:LysR family transcriptional regulator substrate-binding protein n=1 Tax=Bradyrhizobium sp. A5 TaxID=3133696 RepID=UPI00324F5F5D